MEDSTMHWTMGKTGSIYSLNTELKCSNLINFAWTGSTTVGDFIGKTI